MSPATNQSIEWSSEWTVRRELTRLSDGPSARQTNETQSSR